METAVDGGGGGGAKRQRVDEEGDRCEAVDHISELPDELRQRILTFLPLKDAIRTGAVARGWRDHWRSRWVHRGSVEVHLESRDAPRRELDALESEPRPRRRLDRFSLIVDTCKLKPSELRRFTDYAAECRVEDLHVEMRKTTLAATLKFHMPLSSPLLARLSLRRISISGMYFKGAQPFRALEIIRLHSVNITHTAVRKMMALCPSLLTLDLRDCDCDEFFYRHSGHAMPPNLRSVTIAECHGLAGLRWVDVPCLRSFRYSGGYLSSFDLPRDAALADLYIRLSNSLSKQYDTKRLNNSLPKDLSCLNVLTICSNVLRVVSLLPDDGASAQLPGLNLHSLKELQLLMLEMEPVNLAEFYAFLKTCQCPNLERLFVQLPEISSNTSESSTEYTSESSTEDTSERSTEEVTEEPPEDGLDNLVMVKVKNFNWRRTEVQLVSFLLRKASCLLKLSIVSPDAIPLDVPGVEEADLLLIKEALASGKMMLSEMDDAATQPYHSEEIA